MQIYLTSRKHSKFWDFLSLGIFGALILIVLPAHGKGLFSGSSVSSRPSTLKPSIPLTLNQKFKYSIKSIGPAVRVAARRREITKIPEFIKKGNQLQAKKDLQLRQARKKSIQTPGSNPPTPPPLIMPIENLPTDTVKMQR